MCAEEGGAGPTPAPVSHAPGTVTSPSWGLWVASPAPPFSFPIPSSSRMAGSRELPGHLRAPAQGQNWLSGAETCWGAEIATGRCEAWSPLLRKGPALGESALGPDRRWREETGDAGDPRPFGSHNHNRGVWGPLFSSGQNSRWHFPQRLLSVFFPVAPSLLPIGLRLISSGEKKLLEESR